MASVWDIKNLSKDLFDGLVNKAGQQKDVMVAVFAKEVSKFLMNINIGEELKNILDDMTIEVEAKVHLKKGGQSKGSAKVARVLKSKKGKR